MRLSLVIVALLALTAVLCAWTREVEAFWPFMFVFSGQVVVAAVALATLGILGLEPASGQPASSGAESTESPVQVAIRDLMALTGAISLVAATAVYIRTNSFALPPLTDMACFAIWFAASSVASVMGTAAFQRRAVPSALGIAAAAACGGALARCVNQWHAEWWFMLLTATAAVIQIGVLSIYRRCGFRLRRRDKVAGRAFAADVEL